MIFKEQINKMMEENHSDFIKSLISIEKGINEEEVLEKIYQDFLDNPDLTLLSDDFDGLIKNAIYEIERI